MRLWSLHPQYLDAKGLVALWREGLLAQNVLLGKTKGYKNHPQLNRFKSTIDPQIAIGNYLVSVVDEAKRRAYSFNQTKIIYPNDCPKLQVTQGQIEYEWQHLLNKLKTRDFEKYTWMHSLKEKQVHPLFQIVPGAIEDWEIINE